MAVARPEEVVAPSELQISILSEKMSQNQWARMQGVLGVKTSILGLTGILQFLFALLTNNECDHDHDHF